MHAHAVHCGNTHALGEAEVGEAHVAVRVEEEVLRLEVPVHDVVLVQRLVHPGLGSVGAFRMK